MEEIKEIYDVLDFYLSNKPLDIDGFPKLVCVEGLSGSGKTTQINKCQELLEEGGYSVGVVNIPTQSALGRTLRSYYNNDEYFRDTCDLYPWINPLFVAIDLFSAMKKAREENRDVVLMARGVVSTYVLYMEHFRKKYKELAKLEMMKILNIFFQPSVIYYLDIEPDECKNRLVTRDREDRNRKMDRLENLKVINSAMKNQFNTTFSGIRSVLIDGTKSIDKVADYIKQDIVENVLVSQ
ncbi:deoxynucleoside kinase [Mycoplasmatota bacterium WC44]